MMACPFVNRECLKSGCMAWNESLNQRSGGCEVLADLRSTSYYLRDVNHAALTVERFIEKAKRQQRKQDLEESL